jgi:hypothetical protein
VLVEGIDNPRDCQIECAVKRNGLPDCGYLSFNADNECWLSSACEGHDEPETGLQLETSENAGVFQCKCFSLFVAARCSTNCFSVLQVYCSFEDSADQTCADEPLKKSENLPHLTSCFDSCTADSACRLFSFHTNDGGLCEHFASCEGYTPSEEGGRVYMLDAKWGAHLAQANAAQDASEDASMDYDDDDAWLAGAPADSSGAGPADGSYSIDRRLDNAVAAEDEMKLYSCQCLEGFDPLQSDHTRCAGVLDPLPVEVVEPAPAPAKESYCSKPNQLPALWAIPGTQGFRCKEAELYVEFDSFAACKEKCMLDLGGESI